jgi:serine/threonine protein kinase
LEKSARGIYKMNGAEWEYISDEAKDLVQKMLITNPEERISTSAILQHAWIKNCMEQGENSEYGDTSFSVDDSVSENDSMSVVNSNTVNKSGLNSRYVYLFILFII